MYSRAVLVSRDRCHSVCAARRREGVCGTVRCNERGGGDIIFYQNQRITVGSRYYGIMANASTYNNNNNNNNTIPSYCVTAARTCVSCADGRVEKGIFFSSSGTRHRKQPVINYSWPPRGGGCADRPHTRVYVYLLGVLPGSFHVSIPIISSTSSAIPVRRRPIVTIRYYCRGGGQRAAGNIIINTPLCGIVIKI